MTLSPKRIISWGFFLVLSTSSFAATPSATPSAGVLPIPKSIEIPATAPAIDANAQAPTESFPVATPSALPQPASKTAVAQPETGGDEIPVEPEPQATQAQAPPAPAPQVATTPTSPPKAVQAVVVPPVSTSPPPAEAPATAPAAPPPPVVTEAPQTAPQTVQAAPPATPSSVPQEAPPAVSQEIVVPAPIQEPATPQEVQAPPPAPESPPLVENPIPSSTPSDVPEPAPIVESSPEPIPSEVAPPSPIVQAQPSAAPAPVAAPEQPLSQPPLQPPVQAQTYPEAPAAPPPIANTPEDEHPRNFNGTPDNASYVALEHRTPGYQTHIPNMGVELTGSTNALGGSDPSQTGHSGPGAFNMQFDFQPTGLQSFGILGFGPQAGIYPYQGSSNVSSSVAGIFELGAQIRYQARFFQEQWVVPEVAYELQEIQYSLVNGASGRTLGKGFDFGVWVNLNVLETSEAAELYKTFGISRSYLALEMRSLSGNNSDVAFSGASVFFGLRTEF